MNYYFSNLNYPRPESSQMDFFDSTFDENVSSDFLTLLSQENGFLDEDDKLASTPSYLSTRKRIFFYDLPNKLSIIGGHRGVGCSPHIVTYVRDGQRNC